MLHENLKILNKLFMQYFIHLADIQLLLFFVILEILIKHPTNF
jgi:hypothetical protein